MSKVCPGWVGECPEDIASFLPYVSKRAEWLREFLGDKDVVACRAVGQLDSEFYGDISAWLWPPKRPQTNGQWIAESPGRIFIPVPPADAPPSKERKPNSWPAADNLLYVAEWADTVLTAFNHWLDSSGIGGYQVWKGPRDAEFAGRAREYARASRESADVYGYVQADLKRAGVYEYARAHLKRADGHFSRLLSWCHKSTHTTRWERLTKRAHNNRVIVILFAIVLVIGIVAAAMTSLETIGNAMGRAIEWWLRPKR